MPTIKIIYGSNTGNTQRAALAIGEAFDVNPLSVEEAVKEDFAADLIILGSSTWGFGELQDSWAECLNLFEGLDLKGKKAAVFGTGDQNGFSDTFCDALGILAEKLRDCGAEMIGETNASEYHPVNSIALQGELFCGLALDCDNEPEKSAERIDNWVTNLKKHL